MRTTAVGSQLQCRLERGAEDFRFRDTQWSNMTVRRNVGVAHTIVFCLKDNTSYPAVADQMPVVLLACHSQGSFVDVGEAVQM